MYDAIRTLATDGTTRGTRRGNVMKKQLACYNCGGVGHPRRLCPTSANNMEEESSAEDAKKEPELCIVVGRMQRLGRKFTQGARTGGKGRTSQVKRTVLVVNAAGHCAGKKRMDQSYSDNVLLFRRHQVHPLFNHNRIKSWPWFSSCWW